jgi:hypothetical protein
MSARDEYLEMRREVRADMLRGCDTSTVHRCRVCGGVQTVHYGQPPECDCDTPEIEPRGARFFDEDDEP